MVRWGALSRWEEGPRAEMVTMPWSGEELPLLEEGDRTVQGAGEASGTDGTDGALF